MPAPQGRYWLATIPHYGYTTYLPPECQYIRGQLERAPSTGMLHWQLIIYFDIKRTLSFVKKLFGPYHFELSRSSAVESYVWKEHTAVAGTAFELGIKSLRRNSSIDWDIIWSHAVAGRLESIPPDVRVRHYSTLRKITSDHATAMGIERQVQVFWGNTGTGKSKRAWEEAGLEAYPKDPRTKWWDGYQGHENVVIDEFDGTVDICHVLRWFDRYPVLVEIKGATVPLKANKIWITSNIDPRLWYIGKATPEQIQALMRRIQITHFNNPFQ